METLYNKHSLSFVIGRSCLYCLYCLYCIAFVLIFLSLVGCGNRYRVELSDQNRRSIHIIAYVVIDDLVPSKDILVIGEQKPGGALNYELVGGDMKKYNSQFAYVENNLQSILPPQERSSELVPQLFSSLVSPADPVKMVRADRDIDDIWSSNSLQAISNARRKSEPFLRSQGHDAILRIRVYHKVNVEGVYAGFRATLWYSDPSVQEVLYDEVIFSETVPLTDQSRAKATYPQVYREMLKKASSSVYSQIMGRQQ